MLLFKENKVELYVKEDSQGYTYEGERNLIESEVEDLNKLGYDFWTQKLFNKTFFQLTIKEWGVFSLAYKRTVE